MLVWTQVFRARLTGGRHARFAVTHETLLVGALGNEQEAQEGGRGQKRGRTEEQETRGGRVAKAMRQAGAAAGGMARAAARAVWTMFGGRHVEEAAEQSGTRTGDHGEPGEAAVGDG